MPFVDNTLLTRKLKEIVAAKEAGSEALLKAQKQLFRDNLLSSLSKVKRSKDF